MFLFSQCNSIASDFIRPSPTKCSFGDRRSHQFSVVFWCLTLRLNAEYRVTSPFHVLQLVFFSNLKSRNNYLEDFSVITAFIRLLHSVHESVVA